MSEKNTVRFSLDQVREKLKQGESKTDWSRVDAMTDEDIGKAIRDDPDWADFQDVNWSKAEWVIPVEKKSISIRLDTDIIDFFKASGKGYQTRINAVLRHYMKESGSSKR